MPDAYVLDVYADNKKDQACLWLLGEDGKAKLIREPFHPRFYVKGSILDLIRLKKKLALEQGVGGLDMVERKCTLGSSKKSTVLMVEVSAYSRLEDLTQMCDREGDFHKFSLFNSDIRFSQRYLVRKGIFPMAKVDMGSDLKLKDERYSLKYDRPELRSVLLEADHFKRGKVTTYDDPILGLKLTSIDQHGPGWTRDSAKSADIWETKRNVSEAYHPDSEKALFLDLAKEIKRQDPDVIYTADGDTFLLPSLYLRASKLKLSKQFYLGREREYHGFNKKGKSYFTYGRILYRPPFYTLKGRVHMDYRHSFLYRESGLEGLIDLTRLSGIPIQMLSRYSSGTAISAMEVDRALRDGYLVMGKKNRAEDFKTMYQLMTIDRGGFIFDPDVGIHDNVVCIDFTSLYPHIMLTRNISPETLGCECCPDSDLMVPDSRIPICRKKVGLIPRVLDPLLERRIKFKKKAKYWSLSHGKDAARKHKVYQEKQNILKWVLVTCFGYTGYRNARFGRIECHEAITSFGRDILLDAKEVVENAGFRVLHGIVDSLWIRSGANIESDKSKEKITELCERIKEVTQVPVEVDSLFHWIVFLPNKGNGVGALNRYYGLLNNGEIKIRGIEARQRSCPTFFSDFQCEALKIMGQEITGERVIQTIPQVIALARKKADMLRRREVPSEDLIFTMRVSKGVGDYQQRNDQWAALVQLKRAGVEIKPGQSVQYLIVDSSSRSPGKVKAREFLDGSEEYDAAKYVEYLARVCESILLPFGFKFPDLLRRLGRGVQDVLFS